MKNKAGVIGLTVVISFLCAYYLSFSFLSKRVEDRAEIFSQRVDGSIDHRVRQAYLDSVWNEPVLDILGISFTYKELKETELNLGLDLRGGMHVSLEISPGPLLQELSGYSQDSSFRVALAQTQQRLGRGEKGYFLDIFEEAFHAHDPDKSLASVFAHIGNRNKINPSFSDVEVMEVLERELEQAIDRSFHILRARLDQFGTSQPNIQRLQGTQRIQVELPGVDNPERVRKLLQGVAKLEFWEVKALADIEPHLRSINDLLVRQDTSHLASLSEKKDEKGQLDKDEDLSDLFSEEDSLATQDKDSPTDSIAQEDEKDKEDVKPKNVSDLLALLKSNQALVYEVKDTLRINRLLGKKEVKALLPPDIRLLWAALPTQSSSDLSLLELYPIHAPRGLHKPPLGGEVIRDARQALDEFARPSVSMQMNSKGARAWRNLTRDNIGKQIAVVLDDRVYSAPVVQSEIPNGSSQISGNFSIEEAKDLANILKSGALPVPVRIVEDVVIGPTLGKKAQRQGIISILCGLGMVVLFMILYYAKGGLIANVALAFNVFFILGILTQLNSSLTLAGIAGIVLTIGMSVDANVLIFERIREEMRQGVGLRKAIDLGYSKAYSSIIDGNATTFLTALVLYLLGQGPLKSFSITLMIGILCSLFSAIFITRLILFWLTKKSTTEEAVRLHYGWSKNFLIGKTFSFVDRRKKAYLFSATIILLGLVAFLHKGGLNLGVDFLGGRSYVVSFSTPILSPSEIKTELSPLLEQKGVEVKTYGDPKTLKITTSYLIASADEHADKEVRDRLIKGLGEITGFSYTPRDSISSSGDEDHFWIASSSKVGPTIARDIKESSLRSLILSLVVVFLYILFRFRQWQFGLGAIIALFHDVFFALGIISLLHFFGIALEIDQIFVAAMLTLVGYSINDTVIIFDRIRESLQLRSYENKSTIFNTALNKTLSRTMITSATTLFVVVILLLFGGAALSSFSFTLLVGVLIGTYSSVFIAAPSILDFSNKKDLARGKKAKRIDV
ncbi:MAG: protein translocase subunit SecDF [Cytophagales bacterium]|nr:protein translocase subunit SecDF [Cytophagales bacterium]